MTCLPGAGCCLRRGGACGPGSQPSLPDSASPPQQGPRTLWVCPLVHPQLVPSLPFGAYGTLGDPGWHSAIEANSDFADSTCSPPPLGLASRDPPQPGSPSLSAQLGLHPTPGALARVLRAQGSRLGEGGTPGLLC